MSSSLPKPVDQAGDEIALHDFTALNATAERLIELLTGTYGQVVR